MIVSVVEGFSEVEAVPVLLRRFQELTGAFATSIARPIRVPRNRVVKDGELEKAIELARRTHPEISAILVILDTDDDCAGQLGPALLARARTASRGAFYCAVVLPTTEFEAWFVGAAESLAGQRGLPDDLTSHDNPEGIRDAKGWLTKRMAGKTYVEVDDQPAFAARFDFDAALEKCRSFRKFDKEVRRILARN